MLKNSNVRNYSQATTRSYILAVKQFAEYFGQSPEKLGAKEIRRYQLYLLNEKKLTPGTVGIRMSALRFLYQKTLKRPRSRLRRSGLGIGPCFRHWKFGLVRNVSCERTA